MGGRGRRIRANESVFCRRSRAKHSAHWRRRMCGPYTSTLSLMGFLLACIANALGLLFERRAARLEPAASA